VIEARPAAIGRFQVGMRDSIGEGGIGNNPSKLRPYRKDVDNRIKGAPLYRTLVL